MNGPLEGIRVLAVEQFGAGPFCTLQFADLGAEVIKIEDPATGGDVGRRVPPGIEGDSSLYFETFNRGKKSIALDLKNPTGRSVFERLVSRSDAVFNNLRGDQPGKLGLTFTSLRSVNPAIVCVSLSAYGRTDARSAEPGYDVLVQAEAGWAAMTGEPGGPPVRSGLPLVDYSAGLVAAFGMLAGVFRARQTGIGGDIDTSLYDTALSLLSYPATWRLSANVPVERIPMSAHPSIVPFQFFETVDGYIAIACAKEKFFQELLVCLDLDALLSDARFADFSGRMEHRQELIGIIGDRLARGSTSHWIERLRGRVPCASVRSMEDALDVSELRGRDMLIEYRHEGLGKVSTVGSALSVDGHHEEPLPGPGLGADRDSVLREAGFTGREIEALESSGAFGRAKGGSAARGDG